MSNSEQHVPAGEAPRHPSELLEVVDADNRVIGQEERQRIHDERLPHRSAHIGVLDRRGRLYIQKRAAGKAVLPGWWDTSAAGHVSPGESYPDAAGRELGEELGLNLPLRPLYVVAATPETGIEFAAVFLAVTRREPKPDPREIERGDWVDLPELARRLAEPGDERYTANLADLVRTLILRPEVLPASAQALLQEAEERAMEAPLVEGTETPSEYTPLENMERQRFVPFQGLPRHRPSEAALLEEAERGPLPGAERLAERALRVALLAAVALAILAYPLAFSAEVLEGLINRFGPGSPGADTWLGWFLYTQLYPFIASALEPLLLKETIVMLVVCAALPVLCLLLLIRPGRPLASIPWVWILGGYTAYAALTVVTVLPTPSLLAGIYTLTRLAMGGMLVVMAAMAFRSEAQLRRLLLWTGLVLGIMGACALLQHVGWETILPRFPEVRNRMASTIGHNNGVAGALVFAWFPALSVFFAARGTRSRLLAASGLVLLGFLFLALQTRGIWAVLAVLTPPYLYMACRAIGWRPKLQHALIATLLLLAGVLVLSLDVPGNPFSGAVPLTQRLSDLSPDKLRTTTQRRILKTALAYMPEETQRYMMGVGLGGFFYIYPEMQARYWAKSQGEADVLLTQLRTAQAHSDVLQLFIDTGFLGLAFFLVGLFLLARHMEATYRAAPNPRLKLLLLAYFFPVLGTIIHGMGDFPFRVASTATLFCVFLGVVLAAPATVAPALVALPRRSGLQRLLARGRVGGAVRFALLLGCLLLYVPLVPFAAQNQAYLVSAMFRRFATGFLDRYQADPSLRNSPGGAGVLNQARADLQSATRLFPADPETPRARAQLRLVEAANSLQSWKRLREQNGPPAELELWRSQTERAASSALLDLETAAANGLRYHVTVHMQAEAHRILADVATENTQSHRMQYVLLLREAVRLNPAYPLALVALLDFFRVHAPNETEERTFYRQQLKRFNPEIYAEQYQRRYEDALYAKRFAEAMAFMRVLREDDPDNPQWPYYEAGISAQMGDIAQARVLLAEAQRRFPSFPARDDASLLVESKARQWEMVYRIGTRMLAEKKPDEILDPAYVRAWVLLTAEMVAPEDAPKLQADFDKSIQEETEEGSLLLERAGEILYMDLKQPERAEALLKRRLTRGGIIRPYVYVALAEMAYARQDFKAVAVYAEEAAYRNPDDPLLRRLMAELGRLQPELTAEIRQRIEVRRDRFDEYVRREQLKERFK